MFHPINFIFLKLEKNIDVIFDSPELCLRNLNSFFKKNLNYFLKPSNEPPVATHKEFEVRQTA